MEPAEQSNKSMMPEIATPDQEAILQDAFNRWHYWRNIDHTNLYNLSLDERREASKQSLADAKICFEAAEVGAFPGQSNHLRDGARDLLLNSLFLAPEEVTDEKIDQAIDLSVELSRQAVNTPWDYDTFKKNHIKLYDLQHLLAFWESREAEKDGDDRRLATARVMLGGIIADSANDIQHLIKYEKNLDLGDAKKTKGARGAVQGVAAEFILLTCMRLNGLFNHSVSELQLRSALTFEDNLSADRQISADMVRQRTGDREPARFVQCKSGSSGVYDESITVVKVDWKRISKDAEWISFLLGDFVDNKVIKDQASLLQELNYLLGLDRRNQQSLQELTA
jgi:hypothetical protein